MLAKIIWIQAYVYFKNRLNNRLLWWKNNKLLEIKNVLGKFTILPLSYLEVVGYINKLLR